MIGIQDMMAKVQAGAAQLAKVEAFKLALGRAMTDEQGVALSRMIDDKTLEGAFERWLDTDAGRTALRTFVDGFLARVGVA